MDAAKHALLRSLDPKQPTRALAVLTGAARSLRCSVDEVVAAGTTGGPLPPALRATVDAISSAWPGIWDHLRGSWYWRCTPCGMEYKTAAEASGCDCQTKANKAVEVEALERHEKTHGPAVAPTGKPADKPRPVPPTPAK